MFEANKQTKQQYNVPTRHFINTPSNGVTQQQALKMALKLALVPVCSTSSSAMAPRRGHVQTTTTTQC
jgi:hypothetical protein